MGIPHNPILPLPRRAISPTNLPAETNWSITLPRVGRHRRPPGRDREAEINRREKEEPAVATQDFKPFGEGGELWEIVLQ